MSLNDLQRHAEHLKTLESRLDIQQWLVLQSTRVPRLREPGVFKPNSDHFVPECAAPMWVQVEPTVDGGMRIKAQVSHAITMGVVGVINDAIRHMSPDQIMELKFQDFHAFAKYLPNHSQKTCQAVLNRIQYLIRKSGMAG